MMQRPPVFKIASTTLAAQVSTACTAAVAAAITPEDARAITWRVTPEGTGDFPTIATAVLASANGDTIELADGVFTGDGNRDVMLRGHILTILSESGDPELCVIDCGGTELEPHRGFHAMADTVGDYKIVGVTVTGGWVEDYGGGVLSENSLGMGLEYVSFDFDFDIVDCNLIGNSPSGLGIVGMGAASRLRGCHLDLNNGSGVELIDANLAGADSCTFADNTEYGFVGTGYFISVGQGLNDSEIIRNGADGILMQTDYHGILEIRRCRVAHNEGWGASGVGSPQLAGGLVFENCNISSNGDGGIFADMIEWYIIAENCTLSFNHGPGTMCRCQLWPEIHNCQIIANSGHGIQFESNPEDFKQGKPGIRDIRASINNLGLHDNFIAENSQCGIFWDTRYIAGVAIENNVICANGSHGISLSGQGVDSSLRCVIKQCSIVRNFGDAINWDGDLTASISGCILAHNTGSSVLIGSEAQWPKIKECCIHGNGENWPPPLSWIPSDWDNFGYQPLFCDPAAEDFHLCTDSPCLPGNEWSISTEMVGALGAGCDACGPPVAVPGLAATMLLPPRPNPANPGCAFAFVLEGDTIARLTIHDLTGRLVATVCSRRLEAGPHTIDWKGRTNEGRAIPSGCYFARLEAGGATASEKFTLVK